VIYSEYFMWADLGAVECYLRRSDCRKQSCHYESIYKDEGVVKDRVVLCSVCDTACWPELS